MPRSSTTSSTRTLSALPERLEHNIAQQPDLRRSVCGPEVYKRQRLVCQQHHLRAGGRDRERRHLHGVGRPRYRPQRIQRHPHRQHHCGARRHRHQGGGCRAGRFVSDYNLFYTGAGGRVGNWLGLDRTSLAQWRTATQRDSNSRFGDPTFRQCGRSGWHPRLRLAVRRRQRRRLPRPEPQRQLPRRLARRRAQCRHRPAGIPHRDAHHRRRELARDRPWRPERTGRRRDRAQRRDHRDRHLWRHRTGLAQPGRVPGRYLAGRRRDAVPGRDRDHQVEHVQRLRHGGSRRHHRWRQFHHHRLRHRQQRSTTPGWSTAAYSRPAPITVSASRPLPTPTIFGLSDQTFTISAPVHAYYVNDNSTAGDQYTTAVGNDANTGLTRGRADGVAPGAARQIQPAPAATPSMSTPATTPSPPISSSLRPTPAPRTPSALSSRARRTPVAPPPSTAAAGRAVSMHSSSRARSSSPAEPAHHRRRIRRRCGQTAGTVSGITLANDTIDGNNSGVYVGVGDNGFVLSGSTLTASSSASGYGVYLVQTDRHGGQLDVHQFPVGRQSQLDHQHDFARRHLRQRYRRDQHELRDNILFDQLNVSGGYYGIEHLPCRTASSRIASCTTRGRSA